MSLFAFSLHFNIIYQCDVILLQLNLPDQVNEERKLKLDYIIIINIITLHNISSVRHFEREANLELEEEKELIVEDDASN